MDWYLVFLGTVTIPVRAEGIESARATVVDSYAERSVALERHELRVRRAQLSDVDWLRDAGADLVVSDLLGVEEVTG